MTDPATASTASTASTTSTTSTTSAASTYPADKLVEFATRIFLAAGLGERKADAVARILVDGDLMGHDTHGLALLAPYLAAIEARTMQIEGEPEVVADAPAAVTWDGRRLPGPWLVLKAMDLAAERAHKFGTGTVVIRRSHHIACLAAYLKRATDRGLLMILACSDPASASVAPFGGLDPVFTPNPVAAGIPTSDMPVLIDISTSATTNGLTRRVHGEGGKLPAPWVIDSNGQATDDPAVLFSNPAGTILPLGGLDSGHKGYGLTLLVEALTGGLAGHGRADANEGWGATVFLQMIDPQAFAGLDAFTRQTSAVTQQCRESRPSKPGTTVRTPGERGLERATYQLEAGVKLHPSIVPMLEPWAAKLGVPLPVHLTESSTSSGLGRPPATRG